MRQFHKGENNLLLYKCQCNNHLWGWGASKFLIIFHDPWWCSSCGAVSEVSGHFILIWFARDWVPGAKHPLARELASGNKESYISFQDNNHPGVWYGTRCLALLGEFSFLVRNREMKPVDLTAVITFTMLCTVHANFWNDKYKEFTIL